MCRNVHIICYGFNNLKEDLTMADCKTNSRRDCFREAVCINASRVYDACRDRECLENIPVYFTERDQEMINNAIGVRMKCAEVINVNIDTEPVPFNRGYYCVDLTIYFSIGVDVTVSPISNPCQIDGLAVYHKKAILFGSEGSVKIFSSDYVCGDDDIQNPCSGNLPKVVCQIAEPVCLGARLVKSCDCLCSCCIPRCVTRRFGGSFDHNCAEKTVEATLGIFMIIQVEREVQMLVPVYDFCMPEKICVEEGNSDPCELFSKICFPTEAFFPPREDCCDEC